MRRLVALLLAVLLTLLGTLRVSGVAQAVVPFNATWSATSGALPDSACPKWTHAIAVPEPVLAGDVLDIHTATCTANASYWHIGADFVLPDTFVVEARLRVLSMTECLGPCGHYRAGANVSVTTAPSVGVLFHVGIDEVFVTTSECGGKLAVSVGTTDAPHTYRLVVVGSKVSAYRDGVLLLTSTTYTSTPDHGGAPRVGWGEASSLAFGHSEWAWVRHNGHATGCATTGVAPVASAALSLRAWPNPATGETRVAWVVPLAARTRVAVYDATGRLVRRLHDASVPAGMHQVTWDGRDDAGRRVAPGQYLCRVETPGGTASLRLARVR